MSRLLHAAARGARLDWYDTFTKKWFANVVNIPVQAKLLDYGRYYRIHPDDIHLAYGPISTALREVATDDSRLEFDFPEFALHVNVVAKLYDPWAYEWDCQNLLERSLALLILAESLADEGL